ncbi:monofunctional biosynthetic peptidoglycan transglycosylase [Shimia ponticola]|uniref:monofunctional biosynthetic peptidoglycan transglycosylase n=1 Tax=Shimia ponticola TaxID=2582893 RepID=UPI0011BE936D|nr:monofunctional biosynthetic peptidoglycan transglycosylase [Shimia ponticola]
MARKKTSSKTAKAPKPKKPFLKRLRRRVVRGTVLFVVLALGIIALGAVLNPPTTPYIVSEARRLGEIDREWVPFEDIAPIMGRAAVAAEDANFCLHWGLDTTAIRDALDSGALRGGSTISQQVVKNVYLWHGRSWFRKALEALITPYVEATWSKRRILEVYLNVAEFDEGVFGVEAAARHYFGVGPDALTRVQAARLAAILPNPKGRSASRPSDSVRRRAAQILQGADTIDADGRADCFQS